MGKTCQDILGLLPMEQPILDTNAGKQLSYAATDF